MSKLYDRLDRYVEHDRNYIAPSKLELPELSLEPSATAVMLERRVARTAKLAAVPFVPRDWVGMGHASSFAVILLDEAGR